MAYKSSFATSKTTASDKPSTTGRGYVSSFGTANPMKREKAPLPDPSTIQTVAGSFAPPLSVKTSTEAISNEGDGIFDSVAKGVSSIIEHPKIATAAATKAAILDFPIKVMEKIASVGGFENNATTLRENRQALTNIFSSNLKDKGEEDAAAAGKFVGDTLPYVIGGELLAPIAAAGAVRAGASALSSFGGRLSLETLSKIGNITKLAGAATGDFAGGFAAQQASHTEEDG